MTTKELPEHEILFRQLNEPVASWTVPGIRWQVEFWCDDMAHPAAVAWVMVVDPPPGQASYAPPFVDWIQVDPRYRRKGFATKLVEEIAGRWGAVHSCGVTDEGRAFVKAAAAAGLMIDSDADADEEDHEADL